MGNSRVGFDIFNNAARLVQTDNYYPFGLEAFNNTTSSSKNFYLYNKKELQESIGLYDYGARFYDPVIGRWTSVDPSAEKARRWNPYNYGWNDPIRMIDPDGMFAGPGDLFKTEAAAAHDFGKTFNGKSIRQGKEYGSRIYTVVKGGKTYYTYTTPNVATNASVTPSREPSGTTATADAHTHGKYEAEYDNNHFSPQDMADNRKTGLVGYVGSPNGELQKFDPKLNQTTVIETDLPSDPNDPSRQNTIAPTETKAIKIIPVKEIKLDPLTTKPDNVRVDKTVKTEVKPAQ